MGYWTFWRYGHEYIWLRGSFRNDTVLNVGGREPEKAHILRKVSE